ncbi:unnamed protein product [Victoria cruziana]
MPSMACHRSDRSGGRRLTWLVKSCWPDTLPEAHRKFAHVPSEEHRPSSISTLPDDLLIECLARLSSSSLRPASLVCRKWVETLSSPAFYDARRRLGRLNHLLSAFSGAPSVVLSATLLLSAPTDWAPARPLPLSGLTLSHLAVVGRDIYLLGRTPSAASVTLRYDAWSGSVSPRAPMRHPRKRFAASVVGGKIYVAGGAVRVPGGGREAVNSVEEYDPITDTWREVSLCATPRYGCQGASVGGLFFVLGGVRIIGTAGPRRREGYVYESNMDTYDAEAMMWRRRRAVVPIGGCVVASCGAGEFVYVLASHAVGVSFWRYEWKRDEWRREPNPAVGEGGAPPVRVDNALRFTLASAGNRVLLVQTGGSVCDLWRRSGRSGRGSPEGLVLVYNCETGEWSRAPDLPVAVNGAVCGCVYC